MLIVKCPKCSKNLKVNRVIQQAKVKCSACGHVFVGSSQEVPDAPSARPAAPPSKPATGQVGAAGSTRPAQPTPAADKPTAAPAPARPQRPDAPELSDEAKVSEAVEKLSAPVAPQPAPARPVPKPAASAPVAGAAAVARKPVRGKNSSRVQAIVGIVIVALLIPVAIATWFFITHTRVNFPTRSIYGWLPRDEAERIKREIETPVKPTPVPTPKFVPPPKVKEDEPTATATPTPKPNGKASPKWTDSDAMTPRKGTGDTNIIVLGSLKAIKDSNSNAIKGYTGELSNTYKTAVQSVTLTFKIMTDENKALEIGKSIGCQALPPGGKIPFTVMIGGDIAEDHPAYHYTPDYETSNVVKPAGLTGWEIPSDACKAEQNEDKHEYTVTGTVENKTGKPLKNPKVFCNFVDSESRIDNVKEPGDQPTVTGELEGSPDEIPAGGKANFKITYTPSVPGLQLNYFVRVIGEQK